MGSVEMRGSVPMLDLTRRRVPVALGILVSVVLAAGCGGIGGGTGGMMAPMWLWTIIGILVVVLLVVLILKLSKK